jgi:DNA-binding NtrC family response regulator
VVKVSAGFRRIARPVNATRAGIVLVVDDDTSIRFLCRVNLELDGWTVLEADTIAAARAVLAESDVAVVLLDVHLEDGNGVVFLDEIRRDHAGTPVAMLTGSVGSPSAEGANPDAVIPKPFTLEALSGTVRELAG